MRSSLAARHGRRTTPSTELPVSSAERLLSGPLRLFLGSTREPFLRPDLHQSVTPRADAVNNGRRACLQADSNAARPLLDGGEHGVTMRAVGAPISNHHFDSCYSTPAARRYCRSRKRSGAGSGGLMAPLSAMKASTWARPARLISACLGITPRSGSK